jgi:hypothetical protein
MSAASTGNRSGATPKSTSSGAHPAACRTVVTIPSTTTEAPSRRRRSGETRSRWLDSARLRSKSPHESGFTGHGGERRAHLRLRPNGRSAEQAACGNAPSTPGNGRSVAPALSTAAMCRRVSAEEPSDTASGAKGPRRGQVPAVHKDRPRALARDDSVDLKRRFRNLPTVTLETPLRTANVGPHAKRVLADVRVAPGRALRGRTALRRRRRSGSRRLALDGRTARRGETALATARGSAARASPRVRDETALTQTASFAALQKLLTDVESGPR